MALVTTCPACHTSFKVVQDQLKVAQGRVRCGRCGEVFNGLLSLRDATEPAPRIVPPSEAQAPPPPAPPQALDAPAQASDEVLEPLLHDGAPNAAPPQGATQSLSDAPPDAADEVGLAAHSGADSGANASAQVADGMTGPEPATTEALPSWAERQATRSRSRSSMALALLLSVLLLTQAVFAWRDSLAAHWPATQPLLQKACASLGCRIQALALAHPLIVESSNLVHTPGSSVHRLELVLRNSGSLTLRVPAFELTLSDLQGQLLVRRVITASELGAPQRAEFAAGQTWRLQASLQLGALPVAGYTIEAFQP